MPSKECGVNEKWDDCDKECEKTCNDPNREVCKLSCVAGCVCMDGFYRHNGTCVRKGECP
ncbi:trypsin Inhibitor like cysteine rich domain protein [Ancylostoma ceylanicum]|nr:trypsin Inhibitor like cysteine rich domain protein [Ancylostoma ceylanicum]